jgi:HPt (histidine-containing phosphotransfer) domain-containing protein
MTSNLDAVLETLRQSYAKSLPHKIQHLRELSGQHNGEELRHAAHKLKGSGTSYGFPQVSDICEQLETAAELKDWENVTRALCDLEQITNTL